MKLYDEEELRRKNEKSNKIRKLVVIGMFTTLVLIIALMGIIYYLIYNPNKITVYLSGKEDENLESNLTLIASEDGKSQIVYFPIRKIADKFGYKSYDGDYSVNVEGKENCYIENEKEVAIFSLNSNTIYKIDKTIQNNNQESEYEEYKIENPIKQQNGELFVDLEGLRKGFNLSVSYSNKTKKITINKLDEYINSASKYITQKKYGKLDEKFANQKALLDNMMIIETESNGLKGVRSYSEDKEILGAQYNDITYIPQKSSFIVQKNSKVGIIGNDGIVKIKPLYDKLTLIDDENGLYLAENDRFFGVIDSNENIKIYLEYQKIGVDISQFKQNGLKKGYVLLDKIIPAQKDGKWILFKIESTNNPDESKNVQCRNLFENNKYGIDYIDNIGCITGTNRGTVTNLLLIKEYNVILVQKYQKYGFLNVDGNPASNMIYQDAFIETTSGKKDYFVVDGNGNTLRVEDELRKVGTIK